MPFAIAFIALKHPEFHFYFFLMVFVASLSNDSFFFFGGRFGRAKLSRYFPKLFSRENLSKSRSYFNRYGVLAFLAGRFIPFGAGNSVVTAAGISSVPIIRFIPWTLISCLIYSLIYFYGTFFFGPKIFTSKPALVVFTVLLGVLLTTLRKGGNSTNLTVRVDNQHQNVVK